MERMSLAKQRGDASESLWAAGHPAEGLRLAIDAVDRTREAAARWLEATGAGPATTGTKPETDTGVATDTETATEPQAPSDPTLARFLRARGASPGTVEAAIALEKELATTTLPVMDVDVGAAQSELFDRVTDVRASLARALGDVTLAPRELRLRRAGRIATVVVLCLVTVVGAYLALRVPEGVHARASAHFNDMPDFEPSRILDGNAETSWLLPDRSQGWVEVTLNPARTVTRVRLLNTYNAPYRDRATLAYQLQLFSGGREVQSVDGAFEFSASPAWVTHDFGSVAGVDRVRFTVRTWYQFGGGLAELAIE
jgi:hypothetical protein